MGKRERWIVRKSAKTLRRVAELMKDVDAPHEGALAKYWRRKQGLSRRELAERTGYGISTINAIERGVWASGKAVDEATMQTYRLACAAVVLGVAFDWQTLELHPLRVVICVPGPGESATGSPPPETA